MRKVEVVAKASMERIEEVSEGLVREGLERKTDIEICSGSTWRESVSHMELT